MASVLPKIKSFIFISFICLFINVSVCAVAMASNTIEYNTYVEVNKTTNYNNTSIFEGENVTLGDFAIATGGAFVPFFSIVPLAFLNIDPTFAVFIGIIVGFLSAYQLFLLLIIVLNFIPKLFGSGVDV